MRIRVGLILFLLSVLFSSLQAQKVPPKLSFGVEIRLLQNFGVLNLDSVVLVDADNQFRSVYEFAGGFGFGGVVRVKLTDVWNIETGINYTRQRYELNFRDLVTGATDQSFLNIISYEIPLKGLVYIRLGEKLFANVALGVSANFIASNVEVFGLGNTYSFGGLSNRVLNGAILGGVGAEFRTEEDGYFYLGGSFHQPFDDIMTAQVNYQRDGIPPGYAARGVIEGAYFAIDFRYFFPVKEDKRPKVRVVKPDWKNM
ncbi:outer membrane beta-barrel protein [Cryomorphaceae bacterium 1068]|nr:outer membrane beta-barrel protein [Cryomorphaceae bacterium 1068]